MKSLAQVSFLLIAYSVCRTYANLFFDNNDLNLLVNSSTTIKLTLTDSVPVTTVLVLSTKENDVLTTNINQINVAANSSIPQNWSIVLTGHNAGHDILKVNASPSIVNSSDAFIRITVLYSNELALTSVIVGWLYFVAWSISFYPQMYENWTRKSVVGLNFDFLALNLLGFILYSMFNVGLWIPEIDKEYLARNPRGLNPVQLNDIFFGIHAVLATLITVGQCFIYERGDQQVSRAAKLIVTLYVIIIIVLLVLIYSQKIIWLDFLYYCSYIKLTITLIKYIPQVCVILIIRVWKL